MARIRTAMMLAGLMTAVAGIGAWQAATTPAPGAKPTVVEPGPDSKPQEGIPKGEVIKGTFEASAVYPGTWREYWVYVPSQLDRSKPAPVMVFQDGLQYNAPVVFDNLIHRKEIPPIVGIFVMHGRVKAPRPGALDRMNRSYEYDSFTGAYARFLVDELLPFVAKIHGLSLSSDPNDRAIAGNSSGAIAAFAAAWHRPDAFRRVFSAIGTYVGLRGGDQIHTLIRKTEAKPLRIFLEDGLNDLNNYTGHWWFANQQMLSALEYAGYDVTARWGDGEHNSRHATAIFPEVLRWLWRDYPAPIRANPNGSSRQDVAQLVLPGQDWTLVGDGYGFTEGPEANARGEVFFVDVRASRIYKVGLDGTVTVFADNTNRASGLAFGPDGKLYAAAGATQQIVAYDESGKVEVIAEQIPSNDLTVSNAGHIYITDFTNRKVWLIPKGGTPRVVDEGLERPNGIQLSPDQTTLYVAETQGHLAWAFQVQADGSLTHKQPYIYVHVAPGRTQVGADGFAADTDGRIYLATNIGVQVFDQIGKCHSILPAPHTGPVANVTFGGPDFDELYLTNGDKVFKRKLKATGVRSYQPPVTPPAPRL